MTEPRSGRAVWIVLAGAIAVVAAILFWPARDRDARSEAVPRDASEASQEALAGGGPGGVAARQATTAAVGRVLADVVDEAGEPVDGATVVLRCMLPDGVVRNIEGGTVRTDDDGHLDGPACRGTVCADLRHAALVPQEPWTLEPDRAVILRARGLARIHGEVVDGRGEPVVAATIVAARDPEDDDPRALLPVTTSTSGTDVDGAFSLALVARPPCDPCAEAAGECPDAPLPVASRLLLVARAPGFGPGQALVDLDDADDPIRIVLPVPAPGIRGTLVDPEGRAYPRAYVLARSVQRPTEQFRGSAPEGTFDIVDLGEGEYDLRAIQDGVELATEGPAKPGDRVDLVGPPVVETLVLEVLAEDGRALQELRVDGGPWARATTDAAGRVTAQNVATGAYVVRVKRPGRRADTHTLTVGDVGQEGARGPEASTGQARQIVQIRLPDAAER